LYYVLLILYVLVLFFGSKVYQNHYVGVYATLAFGVLGFAFTLPAALIQIGMFNTENE